MAIIIRIILRLVKNGCGLYLSAGVPVIALPFFAGRPKISEVLRSFQNPEVQSDKY